MPPRVSAIHQAAAARIAAAKISGYSSGAKCCGSAVEVRRFPVVLVRTSEAGPAIGVVTAAPVDRMRHPVRWCRSALATVVLGVDGVGVDRTRSARPVAKCPIRPGEPCTLCQLDVTGPQDCGLVYLVMNDPDLREGLQRFSRGRHRTDS